MPRDNQESRPARQAAVEAIHHHPQIQADELDGLRKRLAQLERMIERLHQPWAINAFPLDDSPANEKTPPERG